MAAAATIVESGLYALFLRNLATTTTAAGITAITFGGATGTAPATVFGEFTGSAFFFFDRVTKQFLSFTPGLPSTLLGLSEFDAVFVSSPTGVSVTQPAPQFRARTVGFFPGVDIATYTGATANVGNLTFNGPFTSGWVWDNASRSWKGFFPVADPELAAMLNQVTSVRPGDIVAIVSAAGVAWNMR